MPNMIKPILHLNGSGFVNLEQQLENVVTALGAALEDVNAAAPHARDYYPGGDGLYNETRRQHDDRTARLWELHREFTVQYLALVQDHEDSQPRGRR